MIGKKMDKAMSTIEMSIALNIRSEKKVSIKRVSLKDSPLKDSFLKKNKGYKARKDNYCKRPNWVF